MQSSSQSRHSWKASWVCVTSIDILSRTSPNGWSPWTPWREPKFHRICRHPPTQPPPRISWPVTRAVAPPCIGVAQSTHKARLWCGHLRRPTSVHSLQGDIRRITSSCRILVPRAHWCRSENLHYRWRMPRGCLGSSQTAALPRWATAPHPNGSPSCKLDLQYDRLERTLAEVATLPLRIHIRHGLQIGCVSPIAWLPVTRLHWGADRRYPRRYSLYCSGWDVQRCNDGEVHGFRHTRSDEFQWCGRSPTMWSKSNKRTTPLLKWPNVSNAQRQRPSSAMSTTLCTADRLTETNRLFQSFNAKASWPLSRTQPWQPTLFWIEFYFTVRKVYCWPSMVTNIRITIAKCTACAQNCLALRRHITPLTLFPATEPLEELSIDIFGPIPTSKWGIRYILVITDRFANSPSAAPYGGSWPCPWRPPSSTRGCPHKGLQTASCRTEGPSSCRTSSLPW